jgi:hypothetical protein
MVNVKVSKISEDRISQGDIFKNIEFIEYVAYYEGEIEVSSIIFPYVIVLTQDCDLFQDHSNRLAEKKDQDKYILSVIVAPLYNAEHVYKGEHLAELDLTMGKILKDKTPGTNLRNNDNPRYHYIEFPTDISITESVIDFKHYFTVNSQYLLNIKDKNWICKIRALYREQISQRFSYYLSRIGLPEIKDIKNTSTLII